MQFLLRELEKRHLDGMLITRPVNVRYISHYTGDDSFILVTPKKKFFFTDPRYTEQAALECPDYEIIDWRTKIRSHAGAVAMVVDEYDIHSLGFEANDMTVDKYLMFQHMVHAEMVPADGIIEEFRSVKLPEEIKNLRISCEIASRAFERICKDIRPGISEKVLAAKLSLYMVEEGSDTKPYGNILISGARTSMLHGIPSDKLVEEGDLVLMDYGCQYHGYLSDMTRTVVVGKATAKQREVYELEQKMVASQAAATIAGNSGIDSYKAGAAWLDNPMYQEYKPYHYPNTGHGIGMFVHEVPFAGPTHTNVFRKNNVVTVEPGIYIPGWGGIRIENQYLITDNGNENLISATEELLEL